MALLRTFPPSDAMKQASTPMEPSVTRPDPRRSKAGLLPLWSTLMVLQLLIANSPSQETVSFTREIQPILRANCVGCHKPGKSKGGLDLTSHAALMKGDKNGPVIALQDVAASPLVQSISGTEPEMPKEGEPLNEQEVTLLKNWISQGAKPDTVDPSVNSIPAHPPIYKSLPAISSLAWSPDGSLLAVPAHHEIILYLASGEISARFLGASVRLEKVTFSPDGRSLAACGGAPSEFGEIQLWDTGSHTLQRSIKASNDTFYGVSFSADQQRVAVGCADKLVRIFSIADGKELMKCDNHIDWVFGTAFSQDGQHLATVSRDKAAKLIDISTGQLIDDINRPRDALICLTKHPTQDLIATGGTEGKIRLFKMTPRGGRLAEGDDKEESFVREYEHMATPIQCIAFSADGAMVACGGLSGEVRVFNTENGQRLSTLKGNFGPTYALAFQPGTKFLTSAGADGQIRFFESTTGELIKSFSAVPLAGSALPGG